MKLFEAMIDKLTSAYTARPDSNIGKLFRVAADALESVWATYKKIELYRDIDQAQGATLDKIGANFGVKREGLPDKIYRLFIKTKVVSLLSGGDVDTIMQATSVIFDIELEDVQLTEVFPAKVRIEVPFGAMLSFEELAGIKYARRFIKRLLAAGVGLICVFKATQTHEGGVVLPIARTTTIVDYHFPKEA